MKLEGIAAFAAVIDAGSVSAAARALDLSKSVVSERLKELEHSLGAQLIHRTTRKLTVTAEGNAFFERAARILREADEARAEIAESRGLLAGPLRISAPVSFGTLHLGRALYPFLQANPGIQLSLDLDDRFVDVAAGGYDVVIRHGAVADARVIVKRLGTSRRYLVASPAYLKEHGVPRNPAELERHMAILYANRQPDWRFKVAGKGFVVVRPARHLRVNNGLIQRDAALAGLGITLLPAFIVGPEISRRTLKVLDVGAETESAEISVAYPAGRRSSAKVLAVMAALKASIGTIASGSGA